MLEVVTKSPRETQKVAQMLARTLLKSHFNTIALEGELGAGKTTFVQGFAGALGIREKIQSPTFVLLKIYKIKKGRVRHLIHIDCYRLKSAEALIHLGLKNLLEDKDAIILIEWADRVRKFLPKNTVWVRFKHGSNHRERILKL
ncbi:MAG: tRNA (adenosine(37)-N6)-threonylcarbamoyltransferase complex ATPase subunit type 1 TsaE [Candidatus Sungbacteria bacterium]|nr:tRNA (adenosine(37)-N6)-threonylcarbamoyltransferase complex ATPase subunit type 1 TsaE [Candidatus Sungbacteria bacterium]